MKPNGQKNDVSCEYTEPLFLQIPIIAPEPLFLQIPIVIYNPTKRDYFCACGT